jgi:hypothetical protein
MSAQRKKKRKEEKRRVVEETKVNKMKKETEKYRFIDE